MNNLRHLPSNEFSDRYQQDQHRPTAAEARGIELIRVTLIGLGGMAIGIDRIASLLKKAETDIVEPQPNNVINVDFDKRQRKTG